MTAYDGSPLFSQLAFHCRRALCDDARCYCAAFARTQHGRGGWHRVRFCGMRRHAASLPRCRDAQEVLLARDLLAAYANGVLLASALGFSSPVPGHAFTTYYLSSCFLLRATVQACSFMLLLATACCLPTFLSHFLLPSLGGLALAVHSSPSLC